MKLSAVLAVLILLALGVALLGYLLPATRQGVASRTFDAPLEVVRVAILDVERQPSWRAKVAAVERVPDGGWIEVTTDGERISFRLLANSETAISLGFQSARGYSGRWDAELASRAGSTTLSVTEQATTPSPLGRILSRLFFDPEAFASRYLDELAVEVARRSNGAG